MSTARDCLPAGAVVSEIKGRTVSALGGPPGAVEAGV